LRAGGVAGRVAPASSGIRQMPAHWAVRVRVMPCCPHYSGLPLLHPAVEEAGELHRGRWRHWDSGGVDGSARGGDGVCCAVSDDCGSGFLRVRRCWNPCRRRLRPSTSRKAPSNHKRRHDFQRPRASHVWACPTTGRRA
jgi:hypothetical protein